MSNLKKRPKDQKNAKTPYYTASILATFKKAPSVSYTAKELCALLKLKKKREKASVEETLQDLIAQGTIRKINRGRYIWRTTDAEKTYAIGRVDWVRPEYAYIVVPDLEKDILVVHQNLHTALDKDLVKVRLLPPKKKRNRLEGVVIEIVERNTDPILGRIIATGHGPKALVEQRKGTYEIVLEGDNLTDLQLNDKVVIKPSLFPGKEGQLTGTVVHHLGPAGVHEVEMHAIMAEFGLPYAFPPHVLESTKQLTIAISDQEMASRRDLRSIPTFTIDPADAQDFDDALSYQKLENGHHQVGIHIADVSYYVLPDTPLDQEAYLRNTSVYLVDRCIPMLPELLSNELCSLRPNEDKRTFSAIFELDDQGKVHDMWLGETVIHSNKRFTYEAAKAILDAEAGDFYPALAALNGLAKRLREERLKQGAINFETRALVFELDEQGTPLQAVPKIRTDAHKLIEEFMLLANKEVATYVAKMKQNQEKTGPTFVYRTHDNPDPEKLNAFFLFVKQLGYPINLGKGPVFKAMHYLEEAIQGTQEEDIIHAFAIRSMAKALYTTEPNPHFALAFRHYSHFTSPIRRYSDVLVHRLLKKYLQGEKTYDIAAYESKCQYAVERERLAANAERASIKYKQVEFIRNLGDQILEGIVSGLTEWNMYVEITSNACEGMIRLSELSDDVYVFEEKSFQVVGKKHKKCYRLGDFVRVQVTNCDLNKRLIHFKLV
jgi:ribonuclease R